MLRSLILLHTVTALWGAVSGQPLGKTVKKRGGMYDEARLIKELMTLSEQYGTDARPVMNASQSITVQFSITLNQVLDLDEKTQILTLNAWKNLRWSDPRMKWNPAEYDDVTSVCVHSNLVWMPDIMLYNSADIGSQENRDVKVVIAMNGDVLWVVPATIKSTCATDISYFPFDQQECTLTFGSWTYDGGKLDLEFVDNKTKMDLASFLRNTEWNVIARPGSRNVKHYSCCPAPYIDLEYNLVLQRRPTFFAYLLVFPCLLLSILLLVTFWIPPESPAKVTLGTIIFLAFFFLLLILDNAMPPTSESVPLIGYYYCFNMVLITLSTFLSVLVTNIYSRGENSSRMPAFMKSLFRRVGCILLVCEAKLLADSGSAHYLRMSKHRNQVGAMEEPDAEIPPVNDHRSASNKSMSDTLEEHVGEIRRIMNSLMSRIDEKEAANSIAREWCIVAIVLDRLFFICYLIVIIISAAAILSQRPTLTSTGM